MLSFARDHTLYRSVGQHLAARFGALLRVSWVGRYSAGMEQLLTIREVAVALRISRTVVRSMLNRGVIPSVPCPGSAARSPHRRVLAADLDAYIASLPKTHRVDRSPAIAATTATTKST